jgi:protein gp37
MSNIEWTKRTWNPMVGCSKVSAGCQNCYAIKDAHRLAGNPNSKISSVYAGLTERCSDRTEWTGKVNFVPERLQLPLKTRKPTTWFVNSMSDLFHESVTDEQLDQIFAVMALTPQHTYQVLTKRPERMLEYLNSKEFNASGHLSGRGSWASEMADFACENLRGYFWVEQEGESSSDHVFDKLMRVTSGGDLPNVWLGVTVENQKAADERIPLLLQTPAAIRFLSCEPLLEEIDISQVTEAPGDDYGDGAIYLHPLTGERWMRDGFEKELNDYSQINWVIAGGESGSKARTCEATWLDSIVVQCAAAKVPCFVKQLGSKCHGLGTGYTGKGGNPEEWPQNLRVRQFPNVMA